MKTYSSTLSLGLIALITNLLIASSAIGYTYRISNGSLTNFAVSPLSASKSAAHYYNYVTPGGHMGRPDFGTESDSAFFWLYENTSTGDVSLSMIFDSGDGSGGVVYLVFSGVPSTGFTELIDDAPANQIIPFRRAHETDDILTTTRGEWCWYGC